MIIPTQSGPSATTDYSFIRYLQAKKTVDDRALNTRVWQALANELPVTTAERPLRVLEVGAGIGTMVERFVEQQMFGHTQYTALDENATLIAELQQQLPRRIRRGKSDIHLESLIGDALSFATRDENKRAWDLLIAHAFLDLVHLPRAVSRLLTCLRPGGLFYFTIVFDGATILQPEIDPIFDIHIARLYHLTMDQRLTQGQPSGDSQSGRHLLSYLQEMGATLLAAGVPIGLYWEALRDIRRMRLSSCTSLLTLFTLRSVTSLKLTRTDSRPGLPNAMRKSSAGSSFTSLINWMSLGESVPESLTYRAYYRSSHEQQIHRSP